MASAYDIIERILHADENTVIVTWDTLHIVLTLLIFIALIILIWIIRLDKCMKMNGSMRIYVMTVTFLSA